MGGREVIIGVIIAIAVLTVIIVPTAINCATQYGNKPWLDCLQRKVQQIIHLRQHRKQKVRFFILSPLFTMFYTINKMRPIYKMMNLKKLRFDCVFSIFDWWCCAKFKNRSNPQTVLFMFCHVHFISMYRKVERAYCLCFPPSGTGLRTIKPCSRFLLFIIIHHWRKENWLDNRKMIEDHNARYNDGE